MWTPRAIYLNGVRTRTLRMPLRSWPGRIWRKLEDKAHRSHATNTRVFTAWAMAEARHGTATGALKLLERATRARGFAPGGITDAAVFSTLGEVCWHHLEDFDRAADAFRRSVETDRRHAAGYYKWATMELRRGRAGRARDLLQR